MSEDIFVPESRPEDALVKQLHTVTYVTADKAGVERAFVEGYGLDSSDWFEPSAEEYAALNPYFGFANADTWEACAFFKKGDGANVQIRVIHVHQDAPIVRPELDGFFIGGATVSFPMEDIAAHEKTMAGIGMKSTIGIKEMEFTGPSGEVYISAEIIYPAPENVYLLGVKRPEIFVPVGPLDPSTGIGGAAYSARNCERTDEIIEFLQGVLGFEIRRDVMFTVGAISALLMPEGTEERFVQAFAPGAQTGYLVFMDHGECNRPSPAPTLGPPCRGIVMWSFMTEDLDEVHARAQAAGTKILSAPGDLNSPFLPTQRTLLLEDPDGFPIEVCAA